MDSDRQPLYEGLEMFRVVLGNGAYVIGKEVAVSLDRAPRRAGAIRRRRERKGFCEATVPVEFRRDAKRVANENGDTAASSVGGKAADNVAILRVESHIGVTHRNFHLGVILSENRCSKQQNEP